MDYAVDIPSNSIRIADITPMTFLMTLLLAVPTKKDFPGGSAKLINRYLRLSEIELELMECYLTGPLMSSGFSSSVRYS